MIVWCVMRSSGYREEGEIPGFSPHAGLLADRGINQMLLPFFANFAPLREKFLPF
jgi:hypothetical protein